MNTTPKRFTATNDVTGALIKSRADGQDAYADGWSRIFGNKEQEKVEIITFPIALKECNYNKLDNYIRSNGYSLNKVVEEAIISFINHNNVK